MISLNKKPLVTEILQICKVGVTNILRQLFQPITTGIDNIAPSNGNVAGLVGEEDKITREESSSSGDRDGGGQVGEGAQTHNGEQGHRRDVAWASPPPPYPPGKGCETGGEGFNTPNIFYKYQGVEREV